MNDTLELASPANRAIHRDAWLLDPAIAFLNHGSMARVPRRSWNDSKPFAWKWNANRSSSGPQVDAALGRISQHLAELIGADPADVVFVHNATAGVNAVLRSLDFRPGDEILATTHDYNACRNVARYVAQRSGATVVIADVPLPIISPQQVIDAVLERVTPRTRLAMLDHITSPTAIDLSDRGLGARIERARHRHAGRRRPCAGHGCVGFETVGRGLLHGQLP